MRNLILSGCLCALVLGCFGKASSPTQAQSGPPVTPTGPILSMNMVHDQPGTQQSYRDAFQVASTNGARGAQVLISWNMIEPTAGTMNLGVFGLPPFDLDYIGKTMGLVTLLTIGVIDTSSKNVPSDLAGVAFNSAQMKSRFHAFLDAIFPSLNSQVVYLGIGNEVDTYLSQHPTEWAAYRNFYEDALAYVHSKRPGTLVGTTATFDGANGASKANVASLNASSDVMILTYYGVDSSFNARASSSPLADFPTMVTLAAGKPLVLQEVGYPSATALSGSESLQADFVTNVFTAWRSAGFDKIPYLSLFKFRDWTSTYCSANAPAPLSTFLCSLGLRNSDNSAKQAWQSAVNGIRSLN